MTTTMPSRDDADVPKPPHIPYLAIADVLRQRLNEGWLLPGEQLPNAKQLAAEFGVSPETASKAVRVLAAEGLVNVIPRYGVFVAER